MSCLRSSALPQLRGNSSPVHWFPRYQTIYRRRRCWGTPKNALLCTHHSISYPNSTSVEKMVNSVLPPSCDSSPGTFSKRRSGGRFASAIRATSKKRVPLVSSANPSRFPATEKLWHGKPAQMRSMSGRSFGLMDCVVGLVCLFIDLAMTDAFKAAHRFESAAETADPCEHIKKSDCHRAPRPFVHIILSLLHLHTEIL